MKLAAKRAGRRILVPATLLLLVSACSGGSGGEPEASAAADTLTRRQKDSLISTLPVPGAGAVGAAQRASDAARARALAHDSVGG
jgi:uncharacterized metal-binding protein